MGTSRTQLRLRSGSMPVAIAYAVVGSTLVLTRLVGLGRSFWEDEIYFVKYFVREGPAEIVAGPDLSHELYGLLAWLASATLGESESTLRLLSAVPFVLGAIVVTIWLHRRQGPVAGVMFLFLATVSPLLLDLSRQARGYGLAFFAMSVLIVAALDVERSGRPAAVAAMCAAGVVGTATLPQFAIAFFAVGAVVATVPGSRRATSVGLVVSAVALLGWYAPHLAQVQAASQVENGSRIDGSWLITAPIDQILLPALIWIEGFSLIAGPLWLPLVAVSVLVMASSPYVRGVRTALILCVGPVATIVVLWVAGAYVWPRYVSYLTVPLFVLLSTGASAVFSQTRSRPPILRAAVCTVALALLAVNFASIAPDVLRLPREANRDAAELIAERASETTPILGYMHQPANIAFYLGRPVTPLTRSDVATRVCSQTASVVYVMQPFGRTPVDVPCLVRPGVEHHRFTQYANAGRIDVWFVPER